ncbi:MAG TPA: hypothetical protein VH008_14740 [Pseudonocardia sp.]|nr:hypothetical protein [Pseudonocardia sp.]
MIEPTTSFFRTVSPAATDQPVTDPAMGALIAIWSPSTWALSVDTYRLEYRKYVPEKTSSSTTLTTATKASKIFVGRFNRRVAGTAAGRERAANSSMISARSASSVPAMSVPS